MTKIISGKEISEEIRAELKEQVAALKADTGMVPGLAVVLVGADPASEMYVGMKNKAAKELGIHSQQISLPAETPEDELLGVIDGLNADPAIHGILVQLPLPGHIDEAKVIEAIDPMKDVDGFHPISVGRLQTGSGECFAPCTPAGVIEMLVRSGYDPSGKHAVVVGRSNIVGKPMALLLLRENASVTLCHSQTDDLPGMCRTADILCAAVGKAKMIKGDWIKPGAVVIDFGVNFIGDKMVGDVDFDEAAEVAGMITPVPGGTGPMTNIMLMKNVITAAKLAAGLK